LRELNARDASDSTRKLLIALYRQIGRVLYGIDENQKKCRIHPN